MVDFLLHPVTEKLIFAYTAHPTHAVLLHGPEGSGKASIAQHVAASLLGVKSLEAQAYVRTLSRSEAKTISIEQVRSLDGFLSRKVPAGARRAILIEDADKMTVEAQNALLKTLEEPPAETYLILTAVNEQALLPTIRSRVSSLQIVKPPATLLTKYFMTLGFSTESIQQAMLISGGLPGLMYAILHNDADHPLRAAVQTARELMQKSPFERLAMVDALAKDKEHALRTLEVLQQMAHVAIGQGKAVAVWQKAMRFSYDASAQLQQNAQAKLVLTNLMLNLSS